MRVDYEESELESETMQEDADNELESSVTAADVAGETETKDVVNYESKRLSEKEHGNLQSSMA